MATEFKWPIYCLRNDVILPLWKSSENTSVCIKCVCVHARVYVPSNKKKKGNLLFLSLPVNHISTFPTLPLLYLSLLFNVFNTTFPCNRRECEPEPQGIDLLVLFSTDAKD